MSSFVQLKAAREKILEFARAVQKTVWEAVDRGNKDLFDSSIRRLELNELYVAVIGLQGVGKSSLLNALLFSKRVFPMDVDETTGCLTYVRNCDEQGERAEIVFEDGRVEVGPASEDFLRSFVDFQHNPDNIMKVRHVNVYAKAKILEDGIVLVDTPGVLSLTSSTHNVTMDFLPEISLGLFVMRTVPTITQDESTFLATTWRFSQNFIFVQNVYETEKNDLQVSMAKNSAILLDIARQSGLSGGNKIIPVNIHTALSAAMKNDTRLHDESGLSALVNAIEVALTNGPGIVSVQLNGMTIVHGIIQAKEAAGVRLMALASAATQDQEKFDIQQQTAWEELDRIRVEWNETGAEFRDSASECVESFRASVRGGIDEQIDDLERLIESDNLDAGRLSKVANDRLQKAFTSSLKVLEADFRDCIAQYIEATKKSLEKVERVTIDSFNFSIDDMPWSRGGKALGAGAAYVGGLGLGVMGGMVLWALFLEGAAAAAATVPVVGWIIAGGLMTVGLVLNGWASSRIKQKLKDQLRKTGKHLREVTTEDCVKGVKKKIAEIDDALTASMESAVGQQQKNLKMLAADRRKSESERRIIINGLQLAVRELDNAQSGIVELIRKFGGGQSL